jgi:hypothetical protein
LNDKSSKEKINIKNGSLIKAKLIDSTIIGFSKIQLITPKRVYVTPVRYRTDSFLVDTTRKSYCRVKNVSYDTISFIDYKNIAEITYINHFKSKTNFALLCFSTGFAFVTIPPLCGLLFNDIKGIKFFLPVMAIAVIPTIWGYYKNIKLRHFKTYKTTDWNIIVKEKMRQ